MSGLVTLNKLCVTDFRIDPASSKVIFVALTHVLASRKNYINGSLG